MPPDLQPVIDALKAGDKRRARALLRPLMKRPTADTLCLAAQVARPDAAEDYLLRALELDPQHQRAKRLLARLRQRIAAQTPEFITTAPAAPPQPSPDQLTAPSLPAQPLGVPESDLPPLKQPRPRPRSPWTYAGCGAALLLSLSLSYLLLLLLGSSLPGQIRGFVARYDPRVLEPEGTLVYATPVATLDGTPLYAHPFLAREIDATPVLEIDGTPVYARPDAVVVVQPVISTELAYNAPASDVLEPGYAHEYIFAAAPGDELAVAVQFFSPFAQGVARNVRLIDPGGSSSERDCIRDSILGGNTGVAFICNVTLGGEWRLRLFGREGESSGVYVVAVDRF